MKVAGRDVRHSRKCKEYRKIARKRWNINTLIAIISVIRPGAANEGKKSAFTRRYQGLEPITYPNPQPNNRVSSIKIKSFAWFLVVRPASSLRMGASALPP